MRQSNSIAATQVRLIRGKSGILSIIIACGAIALFDTGCRRDDSQKVSSQPTNQLVFRIDWKDGSIETSGAMLVNGTLESTVETIEGIEHSKKQFTVGGITICELTVVHKVDEVLLQLESQVDVTISFDVPVDLYENGQLLFGQRIPPGKHTITAKRKK